MPGDEGRGERSEAPDPTGARSRVGGCCAPVGRLVVGVGNPDRGDDGAGRAVARRLAARNPRGCEVRECSGEATSLMSEWTGFDDVVIVDACHGAGAPGSVHRIGPEQLDRVATLQHASTHSLGVAAAIGLARALGTLPRHLVIYAIEALHSREGEGLSPEVSRAADEVAARVAPPTPRLRRRGTG
jgi:hydrogenase maturation protease